MLCKRNTTLNQPHRSCMTETISLPSCMWTARVKRWVAYTTPCYMGTDRYGRHGHQFPGRPPSRGGRRSSSSSDSAGLVSRSRMRALQQKE